MFSMLRTWHRFRCKRGWHRLGKKFYENYYKFVSWSGNPDVEVLPFIACQFCKDCKYTICFPQLLGAIIGGGNMYDDKFALGTAHRLTKERRLELEAHTTSCQS